jgi:hypothetical protein
MKLYFNRQWQLMKTFMISLNILIQAEGLRDKYRHFNSHPIDTCRSLKGTMFQNIIYSKRWFEGDS